MKAIGLTGGIGSGKSTIARAFSALGYPVYIADERAKYLTDHDPVIRQKIIAGFGDDIYSAEGLQRKKIAEIVFNQPDKLKQLNSIIHPATRQDFLQWRVSLQGKTEKPFFLKEAAILFETGGWKELDGIITIYCPAETRIRRVMSRDQADREAVLDRMRNQWPDEAKIRLADFTIFNDETHFVLPQVAEAIRFFSR